MRVGILIIHGLRVNSSCDSFFSFSVMLQIPMNDETFFTDCSIDFCPFPMRVWTTQNRNTSKAKPSNLIEQRRMSITMSLPQPTSHEFTLNNEWATANKLDTEITLMVSSRSDAASNSGISNQFGLMEHNPSRAIESSHLEPRDQNESQSPNRRVKYSLQNSSILRGVQKFRFQFNFPVNPRVHRHGKRGGLNCRWLFMQRLPRASFVSSCLPRLVFPRSLCYVKNEYWKTCTKLRCSGSSIMGNRTMNFINHIIEYEQANCARLWAMGNLIMESSFMSLYWAVSKCSMLESPGGDSRSRTCGNIHERSSKRQNGNCDSLKRQSPIRVRERGNF